MRSKSQTGKFLLFFATAAIGCFLLLLSPRREGEVTKIRRPHQCRFWAAISEVVRPTVIIDHLVELPNSLKNLSENSNRNGWGIGYYGEGNEEPIVLRGASPAVEDSLFDMAAEQAAGSVTRVALGHIRHCTSGCCDIADPHPFLREKGGKWWLFGHNGLIDKEILVALIGEEYLVENPPEICTEDSIDSWIDSELYFILLLKEMEESGFQPRRAIKDVVMDLCAAIPGGNEALNFFFTDGDTLFAFRKGRSLYYYHEPGCSAYSAVASKYPTEEQGDWEVVRDYTLLVLKPQSPPILIPIGIPPDLSICPEDIVPSNLNPDEGDSILVHATVTNVGEGSATKLWLRMFVDEDPLGSDLMIDSIPAGGHASVTSSRLWKVEGDSVHILRVVLDPDGLIDEPDEENNEAFRWLIVGPAPDFAIEDKDIWFVSLDTLPEIGDTVLIDAAVQNRGRKDGSAQVVFSYCYGGGDTIVIDTANAVIQPAEVDTSHALWAVPVTKATVVVSLINCDPQDYDPFNNVASKGFDLGALAMDEGVTPSSIPRSPCVLPPYPNPFNSSAEICFFIPRGAHVRLEIYNLLGQRVCTLANGRQRAGYRWVRWNGRDERGHEAASGLYVVRLTSGEAMAVRKALLVR